MEGKICVKKKKNKCICVVNLIFYEMYLDNNKKSMVSSGHRLPLDEVYLPHSAPSGEQGTSEEQEQVEFLDSSIGEQLVLSPTDDLITSSLEGNQYSIEGMMNRPVVIRRSTWNIGSRLFESFDPWELFLANPIVANRINNFKLLRAQLRLKFVINGNPFFYGRCLVNYNPLTDFDDMIQQRSLIDQDYVEATQKPHVFLDPSGDVGAEMVLPFLYPRPVTDLILEQIPLGNIVLSDLTPLKHANNASESLTITTLAWMEDVHYGGTTVFPTQFLAPQAKDEYGAVSGPADVVHKISTSLVKAPVIGPYALATKIAAGAIRDTAKMFGFSRPKELASTGVTQRIKNSFANYNVPDDVQKLSLDVKQELTIDPGVSGYDDGDELALDKICKKETWVGRFSWPTSGGATDPLCEILVGPTHVLTAIDNNDPLREYHVPAIAFPGMFFDQWRGTIKYRFQVVCSAYHRGRIVAIYDPHGRPSANPQSNALNVQKLAVVDISETTDFTVEVGWGQASPFCRVKPWNQPITQLVANGTMNQLGVLDSHFNGVLGIYILNELTTPNSLVNNDISINVFISAGDDFQYASPASNMGTPTFFNSATVTPQAMDEPPVSKHESDNVVLRVGASPIASGNMNSVYYGENIVSLRQILKRYMVHEMLYGFSPLNDFNGEWGKLRRQALPFEPGYTSSKVVDSPGVLEAQTVNGNLLARAFANMTHIRLITSAYVGWRGAIRYTLTALGVPDADTIGWSAARTYRPLLRNDGTTALGDGVRDDYYPDEGGKTQLSKNVFYVQQYATTGIGGMEITGRPNTTLTFEVPYQNNVIFSPGRRRTRFEGDAYQNYFEVTAPPDREANFSTKVKEQRRIASVAVGEDFNCYMFIGLPVLFNEF
uniref:Putative structural protein n=1 Tax=Picornavirales N_OV_011 TaxID=2016021 RepID=A0A218NJS3_9VIRU|nr:putative structural protein [Picornavirales N_OV_011]